METPRTVELSPFKLMERYGALLQRISEAQFYFLILLLFAIPTTAVAIYCNLAIQWSFLTITSDTAAYQSAIVNTLAGAPFRDTAFDGPNMLGGHTCFSLLLVAPIYAIFPEVDTLFTLQVIGICAGVIPLYLYANSRGLSPAYSFLVSILFIVNPLVVHMIFAPFHPEVWAGTACAALLYFYQKNGQIGFWASAAFAVSCGEFDAPTLIAIGLFIYVSQDELPWRKTYAKNLLIAGFAWLFFAEVLFTPLFHDPAQRSPITVHYENWNVHSVYQLPMAILSDPGKMFSMLFSPYRWGLVTFLVGFPIFFILASPRTALIMAPFPLFFLMIDREFYLYFHSYYFHRGDFRGHQRSQAYRGQTAQGQGGRRGGQPGQERVSGQHEPRDPHAHERHHRHDRAGAGHRPRLPSSGEYLGHGARRRPSRCLASSTTSSTSRRSRRASSTSNRSPSTCANAWATP